MWKELIDPALVTDERIPVVTAIFSDPNETKAVGHLSEADAQPFVDVIDEVFPLCFIRTDGPKLSQRVDVGPPRPIAPEGMLKGFA